MCDESIPSLPQRDNNFEIRTPIVQLWLSNGLNYDLILNGLIQIIVFSVSLSLVHGVIELTTSPPSHWVYNEAHSRRRGSSIDTPTSSNGFYGYWPFRCLTPTASDNTITGNSSWCTSCCRHCPCHCSRASYVYLIFLTRQPLLFPWHTLMLVKHRLSRRSCKFHHPANIFLSPCLPCCLIDSHCFPGSVKTRHLSPLRYLLLAHHLICRRSSPKRQLLPCRPLPL